jgi:predicted DCC family thiol-disulfide oxidoreductase YuxK
MKTLIVYYDGECGLCSKTVQFLKRHDKKHRLKYQTLESAFPGQQHNSFIFGEGDKLYYKSTAALRVVKYLSGLWPILYIGIVVPRFIRNAIYDFVAKNRYKWFGKVTECEING